MRTNKEACTWTMEALQEHTDRCYGAVETAERLGDTKRTQQSFEPPQVLNTVLGRLIDLSSRTTPPTRAGPKTVVTGAPCWWRANSR